MFRKPHEHGEPHGSSLLHGPVSPALPRPRGRKSTARVTMPARESADSAVKKRLNPVDNSYAARTGLAVAVDMLLGATTGMAIMGLTTCFAGLFARYEFPNGSATGTVVGASLMALAVGVRVPRRFALWVSASAWHRFVTRGTASDLSRMRLHLVEYDPSLHWIVLSLVALVAGLFTAFLHVHLLLADIFYDWVHLHFVWSLGPAAILQAVVVFATVFPTFCILGLALVCIDHRGAQSGRSNVEAMGWFLVGVGVGLPCASWMIQKGLRGDVAVIAASLPALVVSILSAMAGSHSQAGPHEGERSQPAQPGATAVPAVQDSPIANDPRTRLPEQWHRAEGSIQADWSVRAGIVAVAGCAVVLFAVWDDFLRLNSDPPVGSASFGASSPVLLVALAVGALIGSRLGRSRPATLGGFGMSCAGVGLLIAMGCLCSMANGAAKLSALLSACASLAAVGFVLSYGRLVLLSRVGDRSSIQAVTLSRMLLCTSLMVWVGQPLTLLFLGRRDAVAVVCALLLAVGAGLTLQEPGSSGSTKWIRIGAFLGSGVSLVGMWSFF